MSKNINPFNLPVFDDAYDVPPADYIRIYLSGETAKYSIFYPSGMHKQEISHEELQRELRRYVSNEELLEEVIRYASNWRRIGFFPDTGLCLIELAPGRLYYGGAGNHTSFSRDYIWQKQEEEIEWPI